MTNIEKLATNILSLKNSDRILEGLKQCVNENIPKELSPFEALFMATAKNIKADNEKKGEPEA